MHDCYIITMIRSTISDVIVIIGVEAAIVLVVGIALVVLLAAVFTVLAVGVNKYMNSKRYIPTSHMDNYTCSYYKPFIACSMKIHKNI